MSEHDRLSNGSLDPSDEAVVSRTSGTQCGEEVELQPLQTDQAQESKADVRPRYHRRAIPILLLYIPLIVVPWALTTVSAQYLSSHGTL